MMDGGTASPDAKDWGPFGRPLFDDPSSRALSRVGVLDIGSNSVRMVVFDGAGRSPAYFFNEKILCGLGASLRDTGHLNPEGRARALRAIRRFAIMARSMGVDPLSAVATAAVREATDGPDFCAEVQAETGMTVHVIDGLEEARLSAQGVLLGWPEASGLVCDIGGSSMELALIENGHVGRRVTSDLGALALAGLPGGKSARKAHIKKTLAKLASQVGTKHRALYLVGGSWRAIARLDMERRAYPLHVLHEYALSPRDVARTMDWMRGYDPEELRLQAGISGERMRLVPYAGEVLRGVVTELRPKRIHISSYGIREGLLYEQMPDQLKRRDPLIEACRYAEARDARLPGFGKRLFTFLRPLFRTAKRDQMRLIKAACLLHDVSWRAHPDYRAEVCFDNATRANLGGLDHAGRVFLGVALMHRYRNARDDTRLGGLLSLLTPEALKQAEVLGKAMRFGAMLSAEDADHMGSLTWRPKKRILELTLRPETRALFGEVAEARFNSLAKSLGADTQVKLAKR